MNVASHFGGIFASVFLFVFAVPSADAQDSVPRDDTGGLQEVVVTASKREESLQDSPISISALSMNELSERGAVGMQDYLSTLPGVSMQDMGAGQNKITMRGIAGGAGEDATVGVYFGEVPLTGYATGFAVDMKLVDMERVEVIRGPQGTLFGSGTMGGVVRNIPKAPNLQAFEGWLTAGLSHTDKGGANYKVEGAVNIPLVADKLAVRLVGYEIDNHGYITTVGRADTRKAGIVDRYGGTFVEGVDDDGGDNTTGVRATVLWHPVDDLDVTLTLVRQTIDQDGFTMINPRLGGYRSAPLVTRTPLSPDTPLENMNDDVEIVSLVAQYDLGWATVVASGSHLEGESDYTIDMSRGPLVWPIAVDWDEAKEGDVAEIRMSSQFDGPFQMLLGYYYEDLQRTSARLAPWIGDPDLFLTAGLGSDPLDIFQTDERWFVKQKAIFGEASYTLFDKLTLTAGARQYDYDRFEYAARTGAFNRGRSLNEERTTEKDSLYKFNATYSPGDNAMVYATYSEGFRLGQPITPPAQIYCDVNNDGLFDGTNLPMNQGSLKSDSLANYELGAKFGLLENRMTINAAVYNIDWKNIPVTVASPVACGDSLQVNAGKARSRGLEFEATYLVTSGLIATLGMAYVNSELAEDAPSLGPKGARLQGVPEVNGHFGLKYDFTMLGLESFIRGDYSYIGEYPVLLNNPAEGGGYGRLDIRFGVKVGHISIQAYGNNLTGEDAILTMRTVPVEGWRVRPRTIGVEMTYQY